MKRYIVTGSLDDMHGEPMMMSFNEGNWRGVLRFGGTVTLFDTRKQAYGAIRRTRQEWEQRHPRARFWVRRCHP